MYNFEGLTSSDFEALSLKYSRDIYPAYKWKATKQNADFNRDIEAFIENDGTWSWGEAKHTKKTFKEVSKSRWDPTILSATLKNNVNEVLLITNGWIPLEYIVRVEHFKSRKKILYINALSLSSWYDKFSSSNDINRFEAKIEKFQENYTPKKDNIVKLFVYDTKIDKLEPCTNLVTDCMYEINIPIFLQEKSDISVNIIGSFNVSEVICKKLTHKYNEEIMQSSLMITTSLENGYSQIIIKGFLSRSENNNLQVVVSSKNKKLASKSFCFSESTQHSNKNSDNAMFFLNSVNLVRQTRKNNIIYLNTIPKDEISADMCINYFEFNDSYIHNAKILCRILVLLLSGADISCYESSTIQSTIQHDFFFFDFWISDIFIGVTDHEFAISALKNYSMKFSIKVLSNLSFTTIENMIIQIDARNKISSDLCEILDAVLTTFCALNSGSLICITDQNKEVSNNECCNEGSIYTSNQLSENDIELILDKARGFHKKTDFFKALFHYELIKKHSPKIELSVKDHFAYADCLNHCGSMKESEKQFKQIIMKTTNENDEHYILEAQTELFNLRFWQLEASNLAEEIQSFMDKNEENLIKKTTGDRVNYAYHNCFNRMMVSYYLVGNYVKGEETYQKYLGLKNIPENYKAFIHMDSARALYSINIDEALSRLNKAYTILEKLHSKNREKRRFLDCKVELAYIRYIKEYETNMDPILDELIHAVHQIRINGYRNLLLKNYLKLANCLLSKFEIEDAEKYINFVKNNCDINENTRLKMLYNRILCSLHLLKSVRITKGNNLSVDYHPLDLVTFDNNKKGTHILLEARIW